MAKGGDTDHVRCSCKENYETKQCWLCESTGEKEYSQAEVDDFIYKMYYKKGESSAV